MGGGGGGRSLRAEEIRRLEETAKESLKQGATQEKCNVFISFVEEDLAEVNLLRGQAKNEKSLLEFNDWSVKEPFDSDQAEYIRRGIRERIRQASVTVVYVSSSTASSKWVDWEIRESIRLEKGVIAMHKGETPPSQLPQAIIEHKIKLVPWNHKAISAAIDKAAKK